MTRNVIFGIAIFAASSLMGPAMVAFATRWGANPMNLALYELVGMLWPFWAMASYEVSMGTVKAISLAVLLNVVTYSAVGLLAGAAVGNWPRFLCVYLCVGALLLVFSSLMAGGVFYVNYVSLAVAMLILSAPFLVLVRVRE